MPAPSPLTSRAENAKLAAMRLAARAAARSQPQTQPATQPPPQPAKQPAQPPQPRQAAEPKTPRPKSKPRTKAPKPGESRNANPSRRFSVETLPPARRAALLAALRASSTRPEALAVLEVDILDALDAVRAGARIPGKDGSADRQVLFRLTGLPLGLAGAAAGPGGKGGTAAAIRDVGERLERALNRQAGTAMRQAPVIREAEIIEEAPSNGPFLTHTHKMDDLVRVPADPPPPPSRPEPLPAVEPPGFLAGWED